MTRLPYFFALGLLGGLLAVLAFRRTVPAANVPEIASGPAAPSSVRHTPPPFQQLPVVISPAVAAEVSLTAQITRALRGGTDAERDRAYQTLLPRLLARDARAAARLATEWAPGEQRADLLREVARQWAEADISAALTWLAELDDADRVGAVGAAMDHIGRTDPAGALELAAALLPGSSDGTLEHRLQLWTEEQPAEAEAWVKARPSSVQRDRLLARAAYVRVQQDPAAAMDLLALMSPDPANENGTRAVLQLWQRRDPAAVAAWLAAR